MVLKTKESKKYNAFDDIDKNGLEKIAKIISSLFEQDFP